MATHRRTVTTLIAAVVAISALLAGCSADAVSAPASEPTPTMTATQWVEQFCTAGVAARGPAGVTPIDRVDPADVVAVKKVLDTAVESYAAGIREFDKLGKSPIKSGDEVVAKLKGALTQYTTALTRARDKIAALPPGVPATTAAVAAALNALSAEIKSAKPELSGLDDAEFKAAAQSAPTCKANGLS